MKISKNKKSKIRKLILKKAVKLIGENGYKKTSMSKIAKEAKIGEATIYNYFPTKEDILYEYCYELQVKTKKSLLEFEEFNTLSLKEQIETLIYTQLELLKDDRSFVLEVYKELFYKNYSHPSLQRSTDTLIEMVDELIDIAIEANEIESFNFNSLMQHLFSDYLYGVIYYWIHDDSENFDNTTIMVDKSLDILYAVLKSGLIGKVEELFGFVVKTHILNYIKPSNKSYSKRGFGSDE